MDFNKNTRTPECGKVKKINDFCPREIGSCHHAAARRVKLKKIIGKSFSISEIPGGFQKMQKLVFLFFRANFFSRDIIVFGFSFVILNPNI